MTIRERTEKFEEQHLSKYAALSSLSKGRLYPGLKECNIRTCFQRDRDRVLHSKAFRRLKHKTQVFIAPKSDHYRTRLTHTLEVAQIARTVARALRLNEDLTEAIALGHDLGHTPFGHSGESALDKLSPVGFRHFEQSLRVVDVLEKNGKGLNLTLEVRDGILCHTTGKEAFTMEGRLIKIADKIAYINHDIDDAVSAGILEINDIPTNILRVLGYTCSERINMLVNSLVKNSCGESLFMDSKTWKVFMNLYDFMYEKVYLGKCTDQERKKVPLFMECMYNYIKSCPEEFLGDLEYVLESDGVDRAVCDYIAGMTDQFAKKVFSDIFIPRQLF